MLRATLVVCVCLLIVTVEAGRSHYYSGPGYPIGGVYGYGPFDNGYAYDRYENYADADDDYDLTYGAYKGYGGYYRPYAYGKHLIPSGPIVQEYVEPLPAITKSVSATSLYQTHPSPYGYDGYAGGYGYVPKHEPEYGGYYKK